MKTSENVDKIFPAFVKAQAEFSKATKDSTNPFFKSKYADLNAYLDACMPALHNNDLAVFQNTSTPQEKQGVIVSIRLIHTSGQWIESDEITMIPTDSKPQTLGSCLTYARRYNLGTFLSMGAQDDDGQKASTPKPPINMPKRSDVNKALSEFNDIEKFKTYSINFQHEYGSGIWEMLSGKQGSKTETWSMCFASHKNRINKVPPVEASKGPEEIQSEWAELSNSCSDIETVNVLETQVNQNRCLDTESNWAILEELHKKFD